jgi:hypothetical protein
MSGVNATIPGTKGTSTLVRATFAAGMLLQHEDLDLLQAYPAALSRLLMRSLFGCGVVCGLVVKVEPKCGKFYVTVGAGLGLDCAGDPIHVPTDQSFALDEECHADLPELLWVILCGTVKRCAPRPSMCGCDDDEPPVRTRERDGFEIRVRPKPPDCACGCLEDMSKYQPPADESTCWCADPCHPCYRDHYEGQCGCHCDECSDCTGKCIVLARLTKAKNTDQSGGLDYTWKPDHSVRRFIRPVLMRDPQVAVEQDKGGCAPLEKEEEPMEPGIAALQLKEKPAPKSQKVTKPPKS